MMNNNNALSPAVVFPALSLGRYRFLLESRENLAIPVFHGSTWRGGLGHALLHNSCPWSTNNCMACREKAACAYYVLYESGSEESGTKDLPRPYLIGPGDALGPKVFVEMTLVGEAGKYLPHLIAAWVRAGKVGVGSSRIKYNLRQVDQILPNGRLKEVYVDDAGTGDYHSVYPLADYLDHQPPGPPFRITIKTPLRLKENRPPQNGLDLSMVFRSLSIRLSHLNRFFCGGDRPEAGLWNELRALLSAPGPADFNLWWSDGRRHSQRQERHVPMGGVVGELFVSPLTDIPTWWDWWRAANLFHLGKAVSMGMGKIMLHNSDH